jgi:hypothetical protein
MLMRTRRAALSVDHVTALNMVEIDFHDISEVIAAFHALHQHFSVTNDPQWLENRSRLQTRLLTAMGESLGYKFEQLDVLDGGYTPQGWISTEQEQQQLRQLLLEVLSGRRALPVSPVPFAPPPPFPPPAPAPPQTP